jgi:hypothetical protein
MAKSTTMRLAQALDVIHAAGFGGGQKYGAVDWRMLTGSNDVVGFTAWPTSNPAETRYLFEFSMLRDGTVVRSELDLAIETGNATAKMLRDEVKSA